MWIGASRDTHSVVHPPSAFVRQVRPNRVLGKRRVLSRPGGYCESKRCRLRAARTLHRGQAMQTKFRSLCLLASTGMAAALMLSACGDCPPQRYVPPQDERYETRAFDLQPDGSVNVTVDGQPSHWATCDARCLAAFQDSSKSCQASCTDLSYVADVTDCAFKTDRTGVTCHLHYGAQEEACNCSIYDC
jgi:hypothetical protein